MIGRAGIGRCVLVLHLMIGRAGFGRGAGGDIVIGEDGRCGLVLRSMIGRAGFGRCVLVLCSMFGRGGVMMIGETAVVVAGML